MHKLGNQLMSKHFTKPKDGTTIHSWINDIKQCSNIFHRTVHLSEMLCAYDSNCDYIK